MTLKTIQLLGHWGAPNPWKVCMVLEELGLPYHMTIKELSEAKDEDFLEINPNGRLPALQDPNFGMTLWESGAIIQYLIEKYDENEKISYKDGTNRYLAQQWLAFQISGQGPYFGQATWFARFHQEKLQSAIDRYVNEIVRVTGVLDTGLRSNGTGWLVGDKMTYADLSFVTWAWIGDGLMKELGKPALVNSFPEYGKWMQRMEEGEVVKNMKIRMARARAEHDLP